MHILPLSLRQQQIAALCLIIILFTLAGIFQQRQAKIIRLSVDLKIKKAVADKTLVGEFTITNLTQHELRACSLSWTSAENTHIPLDPKHYPDQEHLYFHLWPYALFDLAADEATRLEITNTWQFLPAGQYTTYYNLNCDYPGLGVSSGLNSQQITIPE